MDFQNKLYDELANAGIYIDGDIDWSTYEIQRFKAQNCPKKSPSLFVIIHPGEGASYGDWRNQSTFTTWWLKSWKQISQNERKDRLLEQQRFEAKKKAILDKALHRAEELLAHTKHDKPTCKPASPEQRYVKTKRITPYGALQIRSYLALPLQDMGGKLRSIQFIRPSGFKTFKKGTSGKNAFVDLGGEFTTRQCPLWIVEGWATGCTVRAVTGQAVVCAMSASNLPNVAILFRKMFPRLIIRIAADNDAKLPTNIGLHAAEKAAKITNAEIYYPIFPSKFKNFTDFNDLFVSQGLEEVQKQLAIKR